MDSPPSPLPPRVLRPDGPIRLGISSCLLGEPVRWDGGHRRDDFLAETLSRYFIFVPVCPEVAIGLGAPRPPIRLVAAGQGVRAIRMDGTGLDVTERLAAYGRSVAARHEQISGYVLKSDSPSCGMARVKVHRSRGGAPARRGVGIYAQAFMAARPELPMEEEGRLCVTECRENFLERVVALRRWQLLEELGLTRPRLAAFHATHRLSLMAHGSGNFDALERLAIQPGRRPLRALAAQYLREFMAALRPPATRTRHARVLTRLASQLAEALEPGDRADLADALAAYRQGRVSLSVPLALLKSHLQRHPQPSLAGQVYLDPHPAELMPREGS